MGMHGGGELDRRPGAANEIAALNFVRFVGGENAQRAVHARGLRPVADLLQVRREGLIGEVAM
jgi:hypothetical protein